MEMFDARTVRYQDLRKDYQDLRKDYGEIRFICYGVIGLRVHCCIYADRGDVRRIISLRKANKDESNDYFEAIGV